MDVVNAWDLAILYSIQGIATNELDLFFKGVTHLGGFYFMAVLLVVLLVYKCTRSLGLQILIAELLQLVIGGYFLKRIIARVRPFIVDPTIELVVDAPESFSFPSGHSSTAFALAFAVIFFDCPRLYKVIALLMACLTGFSRLYLQVHFPSDVLAGAVLGCACGYASKRICIYLERKKLV